MYHQKRRHLRGLAISALTPVSLFFQIELAQAQAGGLLDGVPDKTVITPSTVIPKPQPSPTPTVQQPAVQPTAPAANVAPPAQPQAAPPPPSVATPAGPSTAAPPSQQPAPGQAAAPPSQQPAPGQAAAPPADPATATSPASPPVAAAPASAAAATADPVPGKGMLDDVDAKPGVMIILPDPSVTTPQPQPSAAPPSVPPPAATAPPPAAGSMPGPAQAGATSLAEIIRAVLAAGVRLTPPASGTPAALALEAIAQQCKKPVAEIAQAAGSLNRPATVAKLPFASIDQKEKGAVYAVTVPVSPAPLPAALSCVASGPAPVLKLDLLVRAREFGPMDTQRILYIPVAQAEHDLNTIFGDPARPWRLATAEEMLALLPVLHAENLWGPDGGQFWTANVLTDGKKIAVETKLDKSEYLVKLNVVDGMHKATPIWVRSRN